MAYRVTNGAFNALPRGEVCSDQAYAYGLVWVGSRPNGTTYTDCMIGPVAVYSCPAGATLSGTNCLAPATQAASVSGYTCPSGTLSGSSCLSTSTQAASVGYSCAPGQTLSGTSCTASNTSSTAGTPIYGCPAGYTLSGSSCTTQGTASQAATANFSCASGTLSGANCLGALRRTRYEAYGNTAAGTVPTGLVYMQQRYYDPIAARFLSVDPIVTDASTGKGFNLYEYAQNNPYRYTDPDGRDSIEDETHLGGRGAAAEMGGGWAGAPSRMTRTPADQWRNLAEARAQLRENVAQGKAGEEATRAKLGDKVAGEQVTFKTSDGTRTRADFVTKDKSVIETKSGDAKLSPGQTKLKADVDAGRQVTPVGQNAAKAGLPPDQPITTKCCEIDRVKGGQ